MLVALILLIVIQPFFILMGPLPFRPFSFFKLYFYIDYLYFSKHKSWKADMGVLLLFVLLFNVRISLVSISKIRLWGYTVSVYSVKLFKLQSLM